MGTVWLFYRSAGFFFSCVIACGILISIVSIFTFSFIKIDEEIRYVKKIHLIRISLQCIIDINLYSNDFLNLICKINDCCHFEWIITYDKFIFLYDVVAFLPYHILYSHTQQLKRKRNALKYMFFYKDKSKNIPSWIDEIALQKKSSTYLVFPL